MAKFPFPVNDGVNGWTLDLPTRRPEPVLQGAHRYNYAVIGAGLTGLAAARRLAELRPEASIALLDAESAGAGASSRNSGFVVEVSLHEGGQSKHNTADYLKKHALKKSGIARLQRQVSKHQIDCDWHEAGKYHCTTQANQVPRLQAFAEVLDGMEIANTRYEAEALAARLGSAHYRYGVHTTGGILLNQAKLILGLLQHLPGNVHLYEHSPVLDVRVGVPTQLVTAQGTLQADQVIVTVNGFLPLLQKQLGMLQPRVFPLTLTASMTRPLSNAEYGAIGRPEPWGVLSLHPMGATVRLTNDRRILMRNTAEWVPNRCFDTQGLTARRAIHMEGLRRRFPELDQLEFEASWSGNVCISRNAASIFEPCAANVFVAGCYNAGGIAMGTLYGELAAEHAVGRDSETLRSVLEMEQANRLPPEPVFSSGLQAQLAVRRFRGRKER